QNMNGQKEKAIQSLSKALQINPNLRFDGYFTSVATSVTGLGVDEAIITLYSDKKRKGAVDKVKEGKTAASAAEHMQEAEKHTWGTLVLDLGILGTIAFLGMLFAVLMLPFGISSRISNVENQIATSIEQAGGESELAPETQDNIALARENIEILRQVNSFIGFPVAAVLAFSSLVGVVVGLIAFGATGHAVAKAMGGEGTLPYMIYNVVGAYQVPLLIIYVLMMLLPVLIFMLGMNPRWALMIVAFVLALVVLFLSFRVNGRIRKAYFGINTINSSVVYFVAGIPYSLIVFGVAFVAGVIVSGMLAPALDLIPPEYLPAFMGGEQPPA
ncbi:MAG: hypothetical protein AAFR22_18365, partial [Chloroflexota bacterium]